jgi:uncharacterized membrane protein YraQ (UPF0718 family)
VLGPELGAARAIGAIGFSIVIGLVMHVIYRGEQADPPPQEMVAPDEDNARPLWQVATYFAAMVGILVFANWGRPGEPTGIWHAIWEAKWIITAVCAGVLAVMLVFWFRLAWWKVALIAAATVASWIGTAWWLVPAYGASVANAADGLAWGRMIPFAVATLGLVLALTLGRQSAELRQWFDQSWGLTKQIAPLLLAGVLIAGFLLGRPHAEGMIPNEWVRYVVGGNSLLANFCASVIGAFMYFATLTEVPILQGLMGSEANPGMGRGPALALLLAGPAVSLPNMLVIRSIMGTQKTIVFVTLVVVLSTITGWAYGMLYGT